MSIRSHNAVANKTESAQLTLEMGLDLFADCYSLVRYSFDHNPAELCSLLPLNPRQSFLV